MEKLLEVGEGGEIEIEDDGEWFGGIDEDHGKAEFALASEFEVAEAAVGFFVMAEGGVHRVTGELAVTEEFANGLGFLNEAAEMGIRMSVDEEGFLFDGDEGGLRVGEEVHRATSGSGRRQVSAAWRTWARVTVEVGMSEAMAMAVAARWLMRRREPLAASAIR